jgi:hypothetical protein
VVDYGGLYITYAIHAHTYNLAEVGDRQSSSHRLRTIACLVSLEPKFCPG